MEHVLKLLAFINMVDSGHGALVFGLIWFVNLYTLGRLFQSEIDLYVVKKPAWLSSCQQPRNMSWRMQCCISQVLTEVCSIRRCPL